MDMCEILKILNHNTILVLKENEEINKTVKELNKLSQNPDEVAKYEEREWSIMRYNVEMKRNWIW